MRLLGTGDELAGIAAVGSGALMEGKAWRRFHSNGFAASRSWTAAGGQDRQQQAEASTAICCLVLLILFPAP